jgi:hypothetical protein
VYVEVKSVTLAEPLQQQLLPPGAGVGSPSNVGGMQGLKVAAPPAGTAAAATAREAAGIAVDGFFPPAGGAMEPQQQQQQQGVSNMLQERQQQEGNDEVAAGTADGLRMALFPDTVSTRALQHVQVRGCVG